LWNALKESKNTASVYLLKQFNSTEPLREFMHDVGIDKEKKYPNGQYRVTKSPALCLGAVDLTAFEMAGAYCTFANEGHYTRPRFILRITDRNGRELYTAERDVTSGDNKQVLSPDVNYAMVRMLGYVAKGAPGISTLKSEVGGKTGTTNDYVDGWYVGVTPRLVVATWVGGEDKWIRFTSIADGQGGVMARPFFAKMMTKVEASTKVEYDKNARFKVVPAELMSITLDCSQYSGGGSGGETAPIDNPNRGSGQPAFDEESSFADPNPAPAPSPAPKPNASGTVPVTPKPNAGGGVPTPKPSSGTPPKTQTPAKPTNRPNDGFDG
jgi:penicillin-binding protein 1A